jgi:hypothetical protein
MPRAQVAAERAFAARQRLLCVETVDGVVLLVVATIALIWANSPLANSYHAQGHVPLHLGENEENSPELSNTALTIKPAENGSVIARKPLVGLSRNAT